MDIQNNGKVNVCDPFEAYQIMGFSHCCSKKIEDHLVLHLDASALNFLEKIAGDSEVLSFFEGLTARNIPFAIALEYAQKVINYAPEWRRLAMDVFSFKATELEGKNVQVDDSLDLTIHQTQGFVGEFNLNDNVENNVYDDLKLLKFVPLERLPLVTAYAHQGCPPRLAIEIAMASDSIKALGNNQKRVLKELCKPFSFLNRTVDGPALDQQVSNYPASLIDVLDILYAGTFNFQTSMQRGMLLSTFRSNMYETRQVKDYLAINDFVKAFSEESPLNSFAFSALDLVDSEVIWAYCEDYYYEDGKSENARIALEYETNRLTVDFTLIIVEQLMKTRQFSDRLRDIYEELILTANQLVYVDEEDYEDEDFENEESESLDSQEEREVNSEDFSHGIDELLNYLPSQPSLFSGLLAHRDELDEIPDSDTVTMQLVDIITFFKGLMSLNAALRAVFEDYLVNCTAVLNLVKFFNTSQGKGLCADFKSFQDDNQLLKTALNEVDPKLIIIFDQHQSEANTPKDSVEVMGQTREMVATNIASDKI